MEKLNKAVIKILLHKYICQTKEDAMINISVIDSEHFDEIVKKIIKEYFKLDKKNDTKR